jgi:hypothetical protein
LVNSDSSLLSEESILFSKGIIASEYQPYNFASQPGIWAVSANAQTPNLVHDSSGWISPDGSVFMSTNRDAENLTLEVVFSNFGSGETGRLMIPYRFWFKGWLTNGYVQFLGDVERELGKGITLEILIVDPFGEIVEEVVKEFELPGFAFNNSEVESFGLFYGYESVDPTNQFVLYSAYKNSGNDFEVRLLNLRTGEIIWKHDTLYLSSSIPQWSNDGSHVLFDVSVPTAGTNGPWWKIISLSRDGMVEELPSQPFPNVEAGQLISYSRSSSMRYILYTALETDIETFSSTTRAFVLDVLTWNVQEICLPEGTFVAPIPSTDINSAGFWLPGDKFVYRVLTEDGQPLLSMYILEVPKWETQMLYESEPGNGINIHGWTHIDFPDS